MPELTPKSLILDLLSAAQPGEAVPVKGLVRVAGLFGFEENAVRVALARLRAAEKVEAAVRGAYRLGAAARAVQEQVSAWRDVEARVRRWDGAWIGVHTAALPRANRKALRRRTRALTLLGFRELSPGLELRPENLVGGVDAVRARLHRLGLEPEAPVFRLTDLGADDGRARTLWPTKELLRGYRRMRRALESAEAKLTRLPLEDACVSSFLAGGGAIHLIVFDPLLPDAIVDAAERKALVKAMRQFDRRGRVMWNRLMRQENLRSLRAPADMGGVERALAGTP